MASLRKVKFWTRVVKRGWIDGIYRTKREALDAAFSRGGVVTKVEGLYVENIARGSQKGGSVER